MNLSAIVLDALLIVGVTVLVMLLIGALSRRLLGVRMSSGRIILAGLAGLGAGVGFESQFVWRAAEYTPAVIPILLGVIVLVAIAVLVAAEILVPQGSLPQPHQWPALTRQAFERNRRYVQLLRIAARHRLLAIRFESGADEQHRRERQQQALALKEALQEAGGAFVKLGQLLSTRPDVLPQEFRDALSALQQRVPAASWSAVEAQLVASLGGSLDDVFATFSHEPLAAASIGQVHAATLKSGETVAVKVRRPGIEAVVLRDIDIAQRLARRFARSSEWAERFGVEALVDSLTQSLHDELDYSLEARNMAALAAVQQSLPADSRVHIPRCISALSSERVLVMEHVSGRTLSDPQAAAALDPAERSELARRLLAAVLAQILQAGVFHADLHPGNIVISEGAGGAEGAEGAAGAEAEVVLLDFGSIGRIDSATRARIVDVLSAFSRGDAAAFADSLLEFVTLDDGQDERALRRIVSSFMSRRLGPGSRLDASVFAEVVVILSEQGLTVPAELTVPFRAIATVEGSLRLLEPQFDLIAEAGDYAQRRMSDAMRPQAVLRSLADEALSVLPLIKRMPHRVDQITGHLAEGRFSMNVRMLADARDRAFLREITGLVVVAFLAGVFGIMSAVLLTSSVGPQLTDTLTLFQVFGYLFMVVTGVLTLKVLFDVLRRMPSRAQ